MDDPNARRLHAKAFEIMCKRGRILVSGSANGTTAALGPNQNVEACVVRLQRDRMVGWKYITTDPPEPQASRRRRLVTGSRRWLVSPRKVS